MGHEQQQQQRLLRNPRRKDLKAPKKISLLPLPPRAPELNPKKISGNSCGRRTRCAAGSPRSDDESKCRQRQAADGERADPRDPAPTLASELPPHSIPAGRAQLCDRSEILAQVEAEFIWERSSLFGKVAGSPISSGIASFC